LTTEPSKNALAVRKVLGRYGAEEANRELPTPKKMFNARGGGV
jgi:hypothetical protein